jgi:hypothetical protein
MDKTAGDDAVFQNPACKLCGHPASSHVFESMPDLTVSCQDCASGRCPDAP